LTSDNSKKRKLKIDDDEIIGYAGIIVMSAGFFGVWPPLGFIVFGACMIYLALHYPQKSNEG